MRTAAIPVDAITLELIQEGFIAIVREMRANMARTAYSSIIYEGQDFSCAIVDDRGQLVAKAPADSQLHIFPVPRSVGNVLERFGGDVHPGDVFLHNDPYTGGTHLNDTATLYPVFLEDRLFAFSVVRVHWGDIGGMTPGSISGQATEIYQEGIRIPAIRIYEGGKPNAAAIDLIFANVRGAKQRMGDFTATLVSCQQASRKLEAMAAKYGADTLRTCVARILDRAEERMRRRLAMVPDGTYTYEAYLESSGRALEPLLIRLAVTVHGDELSADFTGSSPQSDGPTNGGEGSAAASVLTIAKSYLDSRGVVNQGTWRPLHTHAPVGTFLNARLPAACGGSTEVRYNADSAVMGALAAAVPEAATGDNKGTANHLYVGGRNDLGQPFLFYEWPDGGTGGYNGGDGVNTIRNWQAGDFCSIESVEAAENQHPLFVERCEMRQDSAGPGRWRGGFGMLREVLLETDHAVLSVLSEHNILGPHGTCGGEAAVSNRFTVRRGGREIEPSPFPGKVTGFPLQRDDVVVMRTAGGGGYGDPLDRDPEMVWRDVAHGYLSLEHARSHYGVVLGRSGVNEPATRALRAELRGTRVFATLESWEGPEFEGARRILPLARTPADRLGIVETDVVELVNPRGAPLRAWAHLLDEVGDRAYLGLLGLAVLGARPGDQFWLRRLTAWAPPPPGK